MITTTICHATVVCHLPSSVLDFVSCLPSHSLLRPNLLSSLPLLLSLLSAIAFYPHCMGTGYCLPWLDLFRLLPWLLRLGLPSLLSSALLSAIPTIIEARVLFHLKFPSGPIDISISVAVLYRPVYVQTAWNGTQYATFFAWYCTWTWCACLSSAV